MACTAVMRMYSPYQAFPHVGKVAGEGGSTCSEVEDEYTFRRWLSSYGGYVHPSLRLAESPSCQGRWVTCERPKSDSTTRHAVTSIAATCGMHRRHVHALQMLCVSQFYASQCRHLRKGKVLAHANEC